MDLSNEEPARSDGLAGLHAPVKSPLSPRAVYTKAGAPDAEPVPPKLASRCSTAIKIDEIYAACEQSRSSQDLSTLVALATSTGGLLNDEARRIAWPLILKSNETSTTARSKDAPQWRNLPKHKDEDQVKLDVNRSFIYYPNHESDRQLDRRKEELSDVITEVLRRHPMLCYFQGFHDIVQVLLLVLGKESAVDAVAHLSLLRIRDFMLPTLSPSLAHLKLLPAILYVADARLCQHLSQTKPFFALAATLTLYAHEIQGYGDIARLFDFLFAQEAVVSIYLFASIILSRSDELFAIPSDEPEMLHFTLSKLPQPLDIEGMIQQATTLFRKYPPESLPFRAWNHVSSCSVLKTTRGIGNNAHTLADGEVYFAKQKQQLQRQEYQQRLATTIWKYRRPAGGIGLALMVGILSFWLRKSGSDPLIQLGWSKMWGLFFHL